MLLPLASWVLRPVRLNVGGVSCRVGRGATVATALAAAGVPPQAGDLLDLNGSILRPGGGLPPRVFSNWQPLALTATVAGHDVLTVAPAADVREPVRERTQLLPAPNLSGYVPAGVAGTQRLQVGLLSGQALLDTVAAVPTVTATPEAKPPRALALTFDDGPWPTSTGQILDTLARHGAHATFFVLGSLARWRPDVIRRTVANGNEIGIHTWGHANLTHLSSGAIIADLGRCRSTIESLTDEKVHVMRPPYGAINARARSAIGQTGLRVVMWTADTNDWRRPGADVIYSRIMNGARPGAIILCHDGGGSRTGTVAAVRRAVPALQARGYELLTVSQLLGLQPRPEGGTIVLADGRKFTTKTLSPAVSVVIDTEKATLPEPPVELEGQLMLPVRPVLDALHLKWVWSQQAHTLTVTGPFERLVLRLNSLQVETGPDMTEELPVPPILYRNSLMVPLWAVMRVAQARGQYDAATHTLRLISFNQDLRTVAEGNVAPAEWGKGLKWQEYLGGQ
ncbi:MAG: polysaccharide deacetylase family protein [Armatimonadetes bacterium]|nr:polysaccharide deacetylase family protein [Armatimonadota bacterium]